MISNARVNEWQNGRIVAELPYPGIHHHSQSRRLICEVGCHIIQKTGPGGELIQKRVRTTHYLPDSPSQAIATYQRLQHEWQFEVQRQHAAHDQEQERRRAEGLSPLGRFKPVWPVDHQCAPRAKSPAKPKLRLAGVSTGDPRETVAAGIQFVRTDKEALLNSRLIDAKDQYLAQYKKRIGLLNSKGINQNTYIKYEQNLILALALNPGYSRSQRPIDVNKRIRDLTLEDYENFVHFWCSPANIRSGRSGMNYIRALKQMIDHLRVPKPDYLDEVFAMKVRVAPSIAKYNPEVLRLLLRCSHERARLFALLCLNCGYTAIDIVRLRFEHLTDADGNPYTSGDAFITKRREKTIHQNNFTTTCYLWPETFELMLKHKAQANPFGTFFLSGHGAPYHTKTVSGLIEQVIRDQGLNRKFSVKQFRKVGASQVKALADSDAMHMYKANAVAAADKPYILDEFSRLTTALKKFREKLILDGVLESEDCLAGV